MQPTIFPDSIDKDAPIVATFKFSGEAVTLRESHLRWLKEIGGKRWLEGIWLLLRGKGALSVLKSIEGAKQGLAILRERGESLDYSDDLPNTLADFETNCGEKLNKLAEVEIAQYEARIEAEAVKVGLTKAEILKIAQKAADKKGYATYADFAEAIAQR